MRNDKIISIVTHAYRVFCPSDLLRIKPFRRAYVFTYFQYKRLFEDPFWKLAQCHPQLFNGGDILDIGANIGYTACTFAQAMKTGHKVFAFEPDLPSYAVLKEVIQRKNLVDVIEPLNVAMGNSDGNLEFWHNKRHPTDHRVVTKQFRELGRKGFTFSTIPITTVDTFVATRRLKKISFIKIDVQGYELAVCQGMKMTLEKFPDLRICLEYSPETMLELGFEPEELLDLFRTAGYKSYSVANGNMKILSDDNKIDILLKNIKYVDLLFSKQDLL
jgi:FkbM family methyltransferase